MNNAPPASIVRLHREQLRLRVVLAAVLLLAVCVFALAISWMGRASPVQPLLMVQASLLSLLAVYAVAVGVAWIYARWIRGKRDPLVREWLAKRDSKE